MKIFISWSGEISHTAALILKKWLPMVIQIAEPYVSSEDIAKGARWSEDIEKALEESVFGILCVTKENIHSLWLSFEAGALSKIAGQSYVVPFLIDIKQEEVDGPIAQFQSMVYQKEDFNRLIDTIYKAGLKEFEDGKRYFVSREIIQMSFDRMYPELESHLDKLPLHKESNSIPEAGDDGSWENNVLHEDCCDIEEPEAAGEYPVFGSRWKRREIHEIRFRSTLSDVPLDSWDVSEEGDDSAMAWVVRTGSQNCLFIAENGGVRIRNGRGMFAGYKQ